MLKILFSFGFVSHRARLHFFGIACFFIIVVFVHPRVNAFSFGVISRNKPHRMLYWLLGLALGTGAETPFLTLMLVLLDRDVRFNVQKSLR